MSKDDVTEIRRVHRQWWASNRGLDIELMQGCFAPQYLMWNLNGHPYYGLDEKVALFRYYYRDHMVPTQPVELWDVRVTVDRDMAKGCRSEGASRNQGREVHRSQHRLLTVPESTLKPTAKRRSRSRHETAERRRPN